MALRLGIDAPERVRKVVVLDAPLPLFDPAEVAAMMKEVDVEQFQQLLALDHQQFSELATKLAVDADGERGARTARATSGRAHRHRRRPPGRAGHRRNRSAGLDRPVLCVYGSTSPFRPRADLLAAALPDVRRGARRGPPAAARVPRRGRAVVEEFLDG